MSSFTYTTQSNTMAPGVPTNEQEWNDWIIQTITDAGIRTAPEPEETVGVDWPDETGQIRPRRRRRPKPAAAAPAAPAPVFEHRPSRPLAETSARESASTTQSNALAATLQRLADEAAARRRANQDRVDALYSALRERAEQSLDVSREDPAVRRQADVFSAQAERTRRDYLSDIAERLGPYATGTMMGQSRMMTERMGQASAAFEAELMARELQARRDEITDAFQQMGSLLTAGQVAELQRQLGILDATINQYRTDASTALGYSDLDLRRYGIDTAADTAREGFGLQYYLGDLEAALARERLGFDIGSRDAELALLSLGLF